MPVQASLFYWTIKPLIGNISVFWQDFIEGSVTTKLVENCKHSQSSPRDHASDWFITGTFWSLLPPRSVISGPKLVQQSEILGLITTL